MSDGRPDVESFRRAMAAYATGVVVVTTVVDGFDHAMTANSFASVSLDPLLVLVCVERDSRFHEAIDAAEVWGVSVLADDHHEAARWLAASGRPLAGQLDTVPHRRGVTGVPLLDGSLATLECRTVAIHESGDHDIVVGAVEHLGEVNLVGSPLVYWARRFRALGADPA